MLDATSAGLEQSAPQTAQGRHRATPQVSPSSRADLSALLQLPVDETTVSSIMSTAVITFATETSITSATRIMLERGISGAPVVDESGHPVGIVSKTDLLEAYTREDDEEPAGHDAIARLVQQGLACVIDRASHESRAKIVVGDIMVPYLLAVSDRAPISLAAALMAYEGVHRLLVLDETNQMVGIVSALDVLRWLAQLSGFCLPRYTQRQRG